LLGPSVKCWVALRLTQLTKLQGKQGDNPCSTAAQEFPVPATFLRSSHTSAVPRSAICLLLLCLKLASSVSKPGTPSALMPMISCLIIFTRCGHSLKVMPISLPAGGIKEAFTKAYAARHTLPEPNASRRAKSEQPVWQRRFWERVIRDDADYAVWSRPHGTGRIQALPIGSREATWRPTGE
jgi:hypothetical protein